MSELSIRRRKMVL